MSSAVTKYQKLVDKLYDLTVAGAIPWTADLLDESAFQAELGTKVVELSESRSRSGDPIVVVVIRDGAGKELDRFDDEVFAGVPVTGGVAAGYWILMTDLLRYAKRQATGAEAALDEILDNLNSKIPF